MTANDPTRARVEEARESVVEISLLAHRQYAERRANALIAAVRAEADKRHGDVMGEAWEAGRAMGWKEARAATLAEVRRVLDEEFPDAPDTAISRDNFLAALDQMEAKAP